MAARMAQRRETLQAQRAKAPLGHDVNRIVSMDPESMVPDWFRKDAPKQK